MKICFFCNASTVMEFLILDIEKYYVSIRGYAIRLFIYVYTPDMIIDEGIQTVYVMFINSAS